jgi:phosphate transport system permease protein
VVSGGALEERVSAGAPRTRPGRPPAGSAGPDRRRWARLREQVAQRWFRYVTGAIASTVVAMVLVILYQLWDGSRATWSQWGLSFVARSEWNPVTGEFGALPFIAGTLLTSLMALAIALPVSLGIAILLTEYAPRLVRDPLIFVVELLAAIPSVVFGLWGIFVLAPLMQRHLMPAIAASPLGRLPLFGEPGPGYTLFTASVILAIMIIPIIASLSREVLLAVPRDQKEAALALGATRWEAVRHVVLAYGRAGIFSAAVLGLGRALGETMATTMTIGNRARLTFDYFEPGYSMTAIIANELREAATETHVSALVAIGLVLFVLSFVLNTVGRLVVLRFHAPSR